VFSNNDFQFFVSRITHNLFIVMEKLQRTASKTEQLTCVPRMQVVSS